MYFDDEANARQYISMAAENDDCGLIDVLRRHVPDGSRVLELGMGPGKDLEMLGKHFRAVGSDAALPFLEIYRASHPQADVRQLDAVAMDIDETFDAIYSNKVLIHLTREELEKSLQQQVRVLVPEGVAVHSFWYGEGDEEMDGLRFTYQTEATLQSAIASTGSLKVVEIARYTEMDPDDSIRVVLKKV